MDIDPVKGEAASLEVAKRFPANDRGAQALFWLGTASCLAPPPEAVAGAKSAPEASEASAPAEGKRKI